MKNYISEISDEKARQEALGKKPVVIVLSDKTIEEIAVHLETCGMEHAANAQRSICGLKVMVNKFLPLGVFRVYNQWESTENGFNAA